MNQRTKKKTEAERASRISRLAGVIRALHDGAAVDEVREEFSEIIEGVGAGEIAEMEQRLISEGMPVSEVQRLCDVHVGAFREALDESPKVDPPPGHPLHTYLADNRVIGELLDRLGRLAAEIGRGGDRDRALKRAEPLLDRLLGLENHYRRKENQLFPLLERHGVSGPTQVMWGVHDEIRKALAGLRAAIDVGDAERFAAEAPVAARDGAEMIYKEEKILFPLSLQTLDEEEWAEVRRGEDELGYELAEPAAPWPAGGDRGRSEKGAARGLLPLKTGELSLEQLDLMLTHLPVDLSFVDDNDEVRFYSEGPERIFPRSPAVIGRKVQNCHPPGSVHVVQSILDSFRSGERSVAEFWIRLHGRFVQIRYFAVRDRAGAYRGCLEVSQDVTAIRKLEGERRLLQWSRDSERGEKR